MNQEIASTQQYIAYLFSQAENGFLPAVDSWDRNLHASVWYAIHSLSEEKGFPEKWDERKITNPYVGALTNNILHFELAGVLTRHEPSENQGGYLANRDRLGKFLEDVNPIQLELMNRFATLVLSDYSECLN